MKHTIIFVAFDANFMELAISKFSAILKILHFSNLKRFDTSNEIELNYVCSLSMLASN